MHPELQYKKYVQCTKMYNFLKMSIARILTFDLFFICHSRISTVCFKSYFMHTESNFMHTISFVHIRIIFMHTSVHLKDHLSILKKSGVKIFLEIPRKIWKLEKKSLKINNCKQFFYVSKTFWFDKLKIIFVVMFFY